MFVLNTVVLYIWHVSLSLSVLLFLTVHETNKRRYIGSIYVLRVSFIFNTRKRQRRQNYRQQKAKVYQRFGRRLNS